MHHFVAGFRFLCLLQKPRLLEGSVLWVHGGWWGGGGLVKLIFKYSRWVSWLSADSIRQKPDKFWFVPPQKCWNVSADSLLNLQGQVFCQCQNFTDGIYNIQRFWPLFASSLGFNLCYWHYKIYLGDCGTQLQLFILRKYIKIPLSLRIILKWWKTSYCCSEMPVSAKMTEKWLVKPSQWSEHVVLINTSSVF